MHTFTMLLVFGTAINLYSLENEHDTAAASPAERVGGEISAVSKLEISPAQNVEQQSAPVAIESKEISALPKAEISSAQTLEKQTAPAEIISKEISALPKAEISSAPTPVEKVSSDISFISMPNTNIPKQLSSATPSVQSTTKSSGNSSSANNSLQQSTPVEQLLSHLQFGGSYTWVHISPKGLHSTSGNLGGLQGMYEYKAPKRFYGAAALTWRQGDTKHAGDRTMCYVDTQERFGYTFGSWLGCWTSCTVFTGFGYRHYGEDVSTHGNTVSFGYDEFYVPLGFLTSNQVNSYFNIGFNFQWMPQVYPTVRISPLKGARWVLTNEIANFRMEMPFSFTVSDSCNCFIVFEPFFEYWQDGKTTAETELGTVLDIPRNTYLFVGANLNIGFSF